MINFKNVLILSPHTDDSELGAGGLISKLVAQSIKVTVMLFSFPTANMPPEYAKTYELKEEFINVMETQNTSYTVNFFPIRKFNSVRQDICDVMYDANKRMQYDCVICPCSYDTHQDHKVIHNEAVRIFKHTTMLGYEMPQNHVSLRSPLFVRLSDKNIKDKIYAVSLYKTQKHRIYCQADYLTALAKVRGMQAGVEFAEMFEVIRLFS